MDTTVGFPPLLDWGRDLASIRLYLELVVHSAIFGDFAIIVPAHADLLLLPRTTWERRLAAAHFWICEFGPCSAFQKCGGTVLERSLHDSCLISVVGDCWLVLDGSSELAYTYKHWK